jgi:putative ATP-dependent endonuclease of OLD family
MYISELTVRNFRQFGEGTSELHIGFQPGMNAFVGRNDSGKSTLIDAIRYALQTRDQEFIRVQPEDFHIDTAGNQATEISILCKLSGLTDAEKGAFIEFLSYDSGDPTVHVNWPLRGASASLQRPNCALGTICRTRVKNQPTHA